MYTIEEYNNIQKEYLKDLKSLKQITSYPVVSVKDKANLNLKQMSPHSFKAYFNESGKLIHLVKLEPKSSYKYSYFYNSLNRISKILEVYKSSNRISRENNIIYQNIDNYIEYIREDPFSIDDSTIEIHHNLKNNVMHDERKAVSKEQWYACQTIKNENSIKKFMDYGDGYKSFDIIELNDKQQEIKSFHFGINDNKGDVDINSNPFDFNIEPVEYISSYYDNGLIKSLNCISKNPWSKHFEYKLNDRGHWLEKTTYRDGIPQYFYDRKLEY